MLPALKQVVRLPEDVDLLERLNNAISNATTDNDRDVSATARSVNDVFKRVPVCVYHISPHMPDSPKTLNVTFPKSCVCPPP